MHTKTSLIATKDNMKTHPCDTTTIPFKLAVHNGSHTISKLKPKIRIIHIIAPEIIKTDVKNFRDLVQRLTGKPEERKESTKKGNGVSSMTLPPKTCGSKPRKNMTSAGVPTWQNTHRVKKESEETYWTENPNAFLSFFADVDGFSHDVNGFPLLPFRSSQVNTFGEIPLY